MSPGIDAVVATVCGLALLAAVAEAHAQPLADPTRPPSAAEGAAAAAPSGASAAGLQAIIRRRGEKPAVVINGEFVELGGTSGDARVVAIGDDWATLEGPGGRDTLVLMPGVKKRPARPDPDDAKSGRKKAVEGSRR